MLAGGPKSSHVIFLLLLATFGYLGYQVSEYRTGTDERVKYFLKSTEIIQRRQLNDLPETAIPFYGDSLVHGLAVSRADSSLVNFGIGHDHSENILGRIREDLQHRQFSEYAVAIGINDLGRGVTARDLYHNIIATVELLAFADTVYVHTVLPVGANRVSSLKMNEQVKEINDLLLELPKWHRNVIIVDTYQSLSVDGVLPESFHIGDGLHLNSAANRKWAALLSIAMSTR